VVFVSLQVVAGFSADVCQYLSRVYIDPYWKRAVRRKHSRFAARRSY